eukprot:CAMPEP_0202708324 /NCGR_PEP_ID=MMETSP1385-20130828/20555_1 /ASSEMBLY_ACC=CAM_ASM_000861 /TAXON_ID=933848 /ORGANISM="Elphidium margaritaceum" /LENGTH=536 /DNA_ID=CAMNT_0049367267 /DNA_START=77 /DNA_END=1687 /DNA_ORIENTATION=-
MSLLMNLYQITLFVSVMNNVNAQSEDYLVVCKTNDERYECRGEIVSDCTEIDGNCIIDCTKEPFVCADAEFLCHPHHDCTLICDADDAAKPCQGTVLNATQSSNINVNLICRNERACEYVVVDTSNAVNINLNVSVTTGVASDSAAYAEYVAIFMQLRLPQTGSVHIDCYGHSACQSMKIFANTTETLERFEMTNIGIHALKNAYVSFANQSEIKIVCGHSQLSDVTETTEAALLAIDGGQSDGSCSNVVFDGTYSGHDSDIYIECNGNEACLHSVIRAHSHSRALVVHGGNNGNNVLSGANIYCPMIIASSSAQGTNCLINVHGNGESMLSETHIHSMHGLSRVSLQCDYATSVEYNCYPNEESAPTLSALTDATDTPYALCGLRLMQESKSEWLCVEDGMEIALWSTTEMWMSSTIDEHDSETESHIEIGAGLLHNVKAQIVLSCIVVILVLLGIAVAVHKKNDLYGWFHGSSTKDDELGAYHGKGVMRIPGYTNKNKYQSVEEDDDQSQTVIEQIESQNVSDSDNEIGHGDSD